MNSARWVSKPWCIILNQYIVNLILTPVLLTISGKDWIALNPATRELLHLYHWTKPLASQFILTLLLQYLCLWSPHLSQESIQFCNSSPPHNIYFHPMLIWKSNTTSKFIYVWLSQNLYMSEYSAPPSHLSPFLSVKCKAYPFWSGAYSLNCVEVMIVTR